MMMQVIHRGIFPLLAFLFAVNPAWSVEYPIGVPEQRNGMEIAAVYLQPIRMEPEGIMTPSEKSDVHLEADIRALSSNANGFTEGEWIPYLRVKYEVRKQGSDGQDSDQVIGGDFMPMVANDGPHYGDNVKLMGPGRYTVKFTIFPPNAAGNPSGKYFGRHTDRLTGVRPWFKSFSVEYDLIYAGIGKRGGY
jgi:uncharacterized protein involved in high-affinity Fe2+ transport